MFNLGHFRVGLNRSNFVIPGRELFASEPGIHNHHRAYGFLRVKKAHPGMTAVV
jgi:hypothetical protein